VGKPARKVGKIRILLLLNAPGSVEEEPETSVAKTQTALISCWMLQFQLNKRQKQRLPKLKQHISSLRCSFQLNKRQKQGLPTIKQYFSSIRCSFQLNKH
jgi:hypothetical protein